MTNRISWPLGLSVKTPLLNASTAKELKTYGFKHIEIKADDTQDLYDIGFTNRAKDIVKTFALYDISASSLHLPYRTEDPSNLDREMRKKTVSVQSEFLKAAGDAGIRIAVIHPSREPYPPEEREERMKCSKDTIAKLCDSSISEGITLCVENLPRSCLGRTSGEILYFLDGLPELMVNFDTNHNLIEDNKDFIKAVGDRIRSLHVSDYDFINERHMLPFKGKNDWEGIISGLEQAEYRGRFLYELRSDLGYSFSDVSENYKKLILGEK